VTPLLNEVQAMQNPALGAVLIWRFACGYSPKRENGRGIPVPLAFLVLPVVLHGRTRAGVDSTNLASGFRKFEDKFEEHADLLLAINHRTFAMRPLSLRSVSIALAAGLLTLLPEQAALWPRTYARAAGATNSMVGLMKAAEKLGTWCAQLSLFEVSGILRVEF